MEPSLFSEVIDGLSSASLPPRYQPYLDVLCFSRRLFARQKQVGTTLNQRGQVFIAIHFCFKLRVQPFKCGSKMGNRYPLLSQFLCSLRICLDKQRSECYITKWLCLSWRWSPCWNWTRRGCRLFSCFGC